MSVVELFDAVGEVGVLGEVLLAGGLVVGELVDVVLCGGDADSGECSVLDGGVEVGVGSVAAFASGAWGLDEVVAASFVEVEVVPELFEFVGSLREFGLPVFGCCVEHGLESFDFGGEFGNRPLPMGNLRLFGLCVDGELLCAAGGQPGK